ncbi:ABC transporter permease subunit [Escherichia coli]
MTFLYSDNDPNWEPIALATQSSLNKLGINVKLEKLANATMRDRVGKGDYDIAIGNWSPDLPGGGRLDDWLDPPTHVTGFYLLDALLEGNGEVFFNALQHLILPALTLAFVHLGIVARQIRSAMLEQLSEDYIRTARASGLSGWYIVLCYALPNALIPSITVLGLALGDLLYGAVLTETVFAWPGMGAWVVTSIQALDFPAVMGFAVVVSFAYVLVNLVVDLLYLWIDPRIGRGGGE